MKNDLTGKRFGRLLVVGFSGRNKQRNAYWLCLCDCGNKRRVLDTSLHGGQRSCGCLAIEVTRRRNKERFTTHGLSGHRLYWIRRGMLRRCYDKKFSSYIRYGGRGIVVCDEWRNSFESFYSWSIKNGWNDGLQLDRENNNGPYSPDNCRFVTTIVNCQNKSVKAGGTGFAGVWDYENKIRPYKAMYKRKSYGVFKTPLMAAVHRDMAAINDIGDRWKTYRLNLPEVFLWAAI